MSDPQAAAQVGPPATSQQRISLIGAISLGVGGMIGAGIFSILGVVAEAAGSAMPVSFVIGAVIALLATYSYARLGAKFPSSGGAVEYLVQAFGVGVLSGGVNLFMWVGYVISLALYASGFAAYAATFLTESPSVLLLKGLAGGVVLLFTFVNCLGAGSVGRWETVIVAIKLGFLALFAGAGLSFMDASRLDPAGWPPFANVLFGAGILFIGYEGFGLVANAAGNMKDASLELPRALFASVILVALVYVAISVAVVGNLTVEQIAGSRDYALAEAAKPSLGMLGFRLVAVAALFSTASAINATLFGASKVSEVVARQGELPAQLSRNEWLRGTRGLLFTAGLALLFLLLFDLSRVAMMGSAAFLLIYAAVNAGHLRLVARTGARRDLIWLSLLACSALFVVLAWYIARHAPSALIAMAVLLPACFVVEAVYQARRRKVGSATSPSAS
jgi:amino acid transporter